MAKVVEVKAEDSSALLRFIYTLLMSLLCLPVCVTEIVLPSTYRHSVRGLCGNYDGLTRNEYMKPDGTVVRDLNSFGESWRVSDRQADGLKIFQLPHTVHAHR